MKKLIALVLSLAFLIPAAALAEGLPFGLSFGMNEEKAEAAFAADETLSTLTWDKEDYGAGSVCYVFNDVTAPGTELVASSSEVQVDTNNSAGEMRLSNVSLVFDPGETESIACFRTLYNVLRATYGEPESDPFADVNGYIEWGTLYASWETEDTRVSLSLSRMYEDSVMLNYSSRLNYDKADLEEKSAK